MSDTRLSLVAAFLHEWQDMSDNPYEGFLKAKEAALLAELAAVRAALADIARLTGSGGITPPSAAPNEDGQPRSKKTHAKANPFAGLTMSDAIVEVLEDSSVPLSSGQIWAVLHKAGVEASSADPVKNISWSLRKRARTQDDVVNVSSGKWNLKSRYTPSQLRKLAKSNTGRGNLSREEHVEKTRSGMAKAKARGRRVGAPLFMTPEREAEAERRLGAGESISQIAEDWDISRQTLYTRFNSDRIAQLREQNAEKVC
jgi:hypothetical protein